MRRVESLVDSMSGRITRMDSTLKGEVDGGVAPGISVWQWAGAPIQVADRDPECLERFRVLHAD